MRKKTSKQIGFIQEKIENKLKRSRMRKKTSKQIVQSLTAPVVLQTARSQLEAVELRIKRYSYQQIANALGIGKTEAYQLVQTALQETQKMCAEKTDELRALELQSLDELERGLWTRFEKADDLAAASLILKAKESRAKLTGLNKIEPVVNEYVGTKVYVTVNLDRWDEIIVAKKSKELHP
jgi:hypothetical protein